MNYDQQLQNLINDLNDPNSAISQTYDFTPIPQGKYDVYFIGYDVSYMPFQKTFPSWLVVDFTTPTVTLVTSGATNTAISPQLNGTVSDPTATVTVTINGITYTADNSRDDTWTLAAGSIKGGLPVGTYQVAVTVTSLAGNTYTENKTLTIAAQSAGGRLSYTGTNVYLYIILASGGLLGAIGIMRKVMRS